MDWETLKKKAINEGFIDNGDEVEKYFDFGFVVFMKDGRAIFNEKMEFDEMADFMEGLTKCQK